MENTIEKISVPESITESITEPATVKKRTVTEAQRKALSKARESKIAKKKQKIVPIMVPGPKLDNNYLLATGTIGLVGLGLYYYMKPQESSNQPLTQVTPQPEPKPVPKPIQMKTSLDHFYN